MRCVGSLECASVCGEGAGVARIVVWHKGEAGLPFVVLFHPRRPWEAGSTPLVCLCVRAGVKCGTNGDAV